MKTESKSKEKVAFRLVYSTFAILSAISLLTVVIYIVTQNDSAFFNIIAFLWLAVMVSGCVLAVYSRVRRWTATVFLSSVVLYGLLHIVSSYLLMIARNTVLWADREGKAVLYQPKHRVGLTICFDAAELDGFVEWKMMGVRDYVLGLECGNCYPDGRDVMRRTGMLKFLGPGEEKVYRVTVQVWEDKLASAEVGREVSK